MADKGAICGYFDSLQMFVGIGFNKHKKGNLLLDVHQGGIFHWNESIMKCIDETKFNGTMRIQQKQLNFVGYMSEWVYDLCLSPMSNVSSSAGFEVCLGVVTA